MPERGIEALHELLAEKSSEFPSTEELLKRFAGPALSLTKEAPSQSLN
jgi:hypothetical protein